MWWWEGVAHCAGSMLAGGERLDHGGARVLCLLQRYLPCSLRVAIENGEVGAVLLEGRHEPHYHCRGVPIIE